MTSNIEPLAREMAERIGRRGGMTDGGIAHWVDLHWTCAAAMLESGVMDERGGWVADRTCGWEWRAIASGGGARNEAE